MRKIIIVEKAEADQKSIPKEDFIEIKQEKNFSKKFF